MAVAGPGVGAGAAAAKLWPTSRHCLSMVAHQRLWTAWGWTVEGTGSCTGTFLVEWRPRAVSAELANTLIRVVWGHVPYENTSCAACVVRAFGEFGVLGMRARCIVDVGFGVVFPIV